MKTTPDKGPEITKRFFEAIDLLKRMRIIRGLQTFTNKYNINRWNLISVKKNPTSNMLKTEYLSYLVLDYGISADWLLTGRGEMMNEYPESIKLISK